MNNKKLSKKEQERKDFKEYIDITDKRVLDTKQAKIELIEKDEVFVIVERVSSYWISNYGRLVNNLHGDFRLHKMGNAHHTIEGRETYTDKLVAERFLEYPQVDGKLYLWHIDRDKDNCYYKNLIWVNYKEKQQLENGNMTIDDLDRKQEYITYMTLKSNRAHRIWSGIYNRCYIRDDVYDGSTMCDLWKDDPDAFAEWYNSEYYEVDGESMAVDKDLLCPGNKDYSPDKCCILPQSLNTMLSNSKKHRAPKKYGRYVRYVDLPYGVKYDEKREKYFGRIKPFGHDETIDLSYWETAEEAFAEYKRVKEADILLAAVKYKNKIPKKVYDALLRVEVKPD